MDTARQKRKNSLDFACILSWIRNSSICRYCTWGIHDLTPVYEITSPLPENSKVIGDKAFNSKHDEQALKELGVNLMPIRRKNMKKQWSLFEQRFIIREHREQIETSFSILSDVMGLNRVKATTLGGFVLKTYAAVLALIFYITIG